MCVKCIVPISIPEASVSPAVSTLQVPVRPFKHNEYERFLTCAFPYYASAGSTMAAFFLLGFFFLYVK